MSERFEGLVAATFTPLHEDGRLHLEKVPVITAHLAATGVKALYINGTTGEGLALTQEERREMAAAYIEAAKESRLRSIVQVGHESVGEAIALAEHAAAVGADGISAMPPTFFKPAGVQGLIAFLRPIADAASALPFYYYHIPSLSGVLLDACTLLEEASASMPSFAGIKYSHTDLSTLLACLNFAGDSKEVFYGCDESLLGALAVGCTSAVGSTYNFAARIYLNVMEALQRGDLATAREWQGRSVQMVRAINETCGRSGLKVMMKLTGMDCGPHRLPQQDASATQQAALHDALQTMGFFDWIKS